MIPKSYVVPSIGLLFLRAKTLPPEAAEPEQDRSKRLLSRFVDEDTSVYVHEWGHILQCVHYPYLYLRAVRELAIIDKILIDQRRSDDALRAKALRLADKVLESFLLDSQDFRFSRTDDGGFVLGPPEGGRRDRQDISEIDLLEEANSVFEFRTVSGGHGSAEAYEAWLLTGARYTRTYRMLARALGREMAYEMLTPLVAAAYHTTYPVTAFASLLDTVAREPAFRHLPAPEAEQLFRARLAKQLPRLEAVAPQLIQLPTEDPFAVLDEATMAALLPQSEQYPLHPLAEAVWGARPAPGPGWLHRPYAFIRNRGHRVRPEIQHLQPPITLIHFEDDPAFGTTFVGLLSEYYEARPVPAWWDQMPGTSWLNIFEVLQFRRVLVQNLVAGLPPTTPQFCPHGVCPLHGSGLCNGFVTVPKTPEACHFPGYLRTLLKRDYDPREGTLRRITA